MSFPPSPQFDAELERKVAERTAELSELLNHLSTCWDEERRALARKLHDSLGSSMTALTMHLSLLQQQLGPEHALQERSAQMKQLLATIINTNRDMQLALWNDKLEFLGLKAALGDLAKQFGASHAIHTHISLPDEETSYPRSHALALLRCLEEALRNVAAHAGATEVEVVLDDNDDQITLTVRDNGVGMQAPAAAPAAAPDRCHGLRLLRERAVYLGGKLSLETGAQGGMLLRFTLPAPSKLPD